MKPLLLVALLVCGAATASPGEEFTQWAGFRLAVSEMADVQKRLGPAEAVQTGDASESLTTLCYTLREHAVLFMAGEIDGPNLGGFKIEVSPTRPPCSPWPRSVMAPVLSLGGISIGMSRARVEKKLGPASRQPDGSYSRTYLSKRRMTRAEVARLSPSDRESIRQGQVPGDWDVQIQINVQVDQEKVKSLTAWKAVTW